MNGTELFNEVDNSASNSQSASNMAPRFPNIKPEHKHLFAAYFEMSMHNFVITLNYICQQTKGVDVFQNALTNDLANKKLIWNKLFEEFRVTNPEEIVRIVSLLEKHFPFLIPIWENKIQYEQNKKKKEETDSPDGQEVQINKSDKRKLDTYISCLEKFSEIIRVCRNYYTHYLIDLLDGQKTAYNANEKDICIFLQACYDSAKNKVKERFSYDDKIMHIFERSIYIKNHEGKYIADRNKECICHITSENGALSMFAYMLIIGLFAEKRYCKILTDKLGFGNADIRPIVSEIMSVHRIRLNLKKLTCVKPNDTLALDILTELRKCPKELFGILSTENQAQFRIVSQSEDTEVLMRRESDRFASLIMKFIDNENIFQDIRFMVNLGKYFYKFYDKKCIDSNDRVRCLSKDITGFGRLQEIEEARKTQWKDNIREYEDVHRNTSEESPYISDHHASYIFNGQKEGKRIGLKIYDENEEEKQTIPNLNPGKTVNTPPTCWMSIYELPAMAFLLLLTKNDHTVENIIKQCVRNYTRLYNDIKEGILIPQDEESISRILMEEYGGIRLSRITRNMRAYLTMKTESIERDYSAWAERRLRDMLEETKAREKNFKNLQKIISNQKLKNIGKSKSRFEKTGRIADYLAHDIMLFQPLGQDGKNKLTSLNFKILSSALATLSDETSDDFVRIITSAHIIRNKDCTLDNPIMSELFRKNKYSELSELYKAYLKKKKEYIIRLISLRDYSVEFLHPNRKMWNKHDTDFYRNLAGRYLQEKNNGKSYNKSLELPRGLFEDAIRERLAEFSSISEVAVDTSKNISYLIYSFFKNVLGDDSQSFYSCSRTYPIFNALYRAVPTMPDVFYSPQRIYELLNRKNTNNLYSHVADCQLTYSDQRLHASLQDKKQSLHKKLMAMKKNETLLKRYKIQDMILFMIAKSILTDTKADTISTVNKSAFDNLKLMQITEKEVLSKSISLVVEVKSNTADTFIIKQSELKLKNYGDFYRFLMDRRLPSLLELISSHEIEKEDIEKEFQNYDSAQLEVIKEVLDTEEKYNISIGCQKRRYPGDKRLPHHADFRNVINESSNLSSQDKANLPKVRNSFSHLSYPTDLPQAHENTHTQERLPNKALHILDVFKSTLSKIQNTH